MSQPFVPGSKWSLENQLGRYRVDRNAEQKNSTRQQLRVDEELARERGDFETVSNISRVARGVASNLATEFENKFAKPSPQQAADIASKAVQLAGSRDLLGLIRLGLQTGQLSNIYKAITQLKPKSRKARTALGDIKNSAELKTAINESVQEFVEGKASVEETAKSIVQSISGGDDEVKSSINEALSKIDSGAFLPSIEVAAPDASSSVKKSSSAYPEIVQTLKAIAPSLTGKFGVFKALNKKGDKVVDWNLRWENGKLIGTYNSGGRPADPVDLLDLKNKKLLVEIYDRNEGKFQSIIPPRAELV
jgi:uncharacterized phage infection (PIP) family protein YhgE